MSVRRNPNCKIVNHIKVEYIWLLKYIIVLKNRQMHALFEIIMTYGCHMILVSMGSDNGLLTSGNTWMLTYNQLDDSKHT